MTTVAQALAVLKRAAQKKKTLRKNPAKRKTAARTLGSPSRATGKKPTKRLMARRAKDTVPGYYPNPNPGALAQNKFISSRVAYDVLQAVQELVEDKKYLKAMTVIGIAKRMVSAKTNADAAKDLRIIRDHMGWS